MFILSDILSASRQRVRLDGEVSASIDVVSGVLQSTILRPLLFILYVSELFYIVGNHIVGYAGDTTNYAVISRLLLLPQAMESLNHNLAAINSWCLKFTCDIRLSPKKTKFMIVGRSGNLSVGGGELEEVKSLRILGVTLDFMLTFEIHLREVV